jgi:NitT/TauT family transport system substrate-binding protein
VADSRLSRRRALALASAFAATVGTPHARPATAQELRTIKLVGVVNDTVTTPLYAMQSGIFKKYGLSAEFVMLTSGAAAAAAIAGGELQFGISSLVTLIEAHERGVPFTLVAPSGVLTTGDGYSQFIINKDATLRTGRDLDGKTVAVPALGDLTYVAIMNWVDKNGGNSKTLRFTELPDAAAAAAVADGRVDGAEINTPTLTRALDGGKVRVLAQIYDAIAPRFANTAWFATDDYAAKNRDVVTAFSRSMRDAAVYCNAHHAETVAMVAQFTKLEPSLVARMARITFGETLSARDIQPLIDLAYKYKSIPKTFDAQELISPYAVK